ncbi:MAG: hypothetical protein ACOX8N_04720 [Christensenellales bacterium]|jgi:hypothetical protein
MGVYGSFSGVVTVIQDFRDGTDRPSGCTKLMTLTNRAGQTANFVVIPDTYFIDHVMVRPGDTVTGFYDAAAPVPLIYPPQYVALVMSRAVPGRRVAVDWFGPELISSEGDLMLNIGSATRVVLQNGQAFTGELGNRDLAVVYGPTTRSIPAQATPYQVVVLCSGV